MARVVRKVSNKSVRGQKKQKGFIGSKLFWVIVSAVVVIGVLVGVLIAVFSSKDSEDSLYTDYFKLEDEVTFNVTDYYALSNYVNPDYSDVVTGEKLSHSHVFVFAYDISLFTPFSTDDVEAVKAHESLYKKLVDLQKAVDAAQEKGVDVELYIIDTTFLANVTVMTDPSFVGATLASDDQSKFLFTYLEEGEVIVEDDDDKSFVTKTINNMDTTLLPKAIKYINSLA